MNDPRPAARGGDPPAWTKKSDPTPTEDAVLTTERLAMRRLSRAHLADLQALYADPEVARFLKPLDEAGHLRRIEEAEQMWAMRGHGRVAVHEMHSGRFLGRSGLQHWPDHDEVEITWAFHSEAWGHGFATETGRAWLQWGFAHLDIPYITAYIAPENEASRAVADRLGMSVRRTDMQHGREVLVYGASRETGTHDQR